MKLSRTASYAVQALVQIALADRERPVPCSQIAAAGQMPERFLLQILRSLVNRGVLVSMRGISGGYKLSREPSEISLLDIIEAADGPFDSAIPSGGTFSKETRTRLQQVMNTAVEHLRSHLASVTLAQLLPTNSKRPSDARHSK